MRADILTHSIGTATAARRTKFSVFLPMGSRALGRFSAWLSTCELRGRTLSPDCTDRLCKAGDTGVRSARSVASRTLARNGFLERIVGSQSSHGRRAPSFGGQLQSAQNCLGTARIQSFDGPLHLAPSFTMFGNCPESSSPSNLPRNFDRAPKSLGIVQIGPDAAFLATY